MRLTLIAAAGALLLPAGVPGPLVAADPPAPLTGIDAEFAAAVVTGLRAAQPGWPEAMTTEAAACVVDGFLPVLSESHKRQAIDTQFSDELGFELRKVYPDTFAAITACLDAVTEKYE
jgi:hypothetical protein